MTLQPRPLTVNLRNLKGKGAARKLRHQGEIPAVIYGQGKDHVMVSLNPRNLHRAADPERNFNTWFEINVEHNGKTTTTESCIIIDHQVDKVRGGIIHLDFLRVNPEQEIVVTIPVAYTGRAAGVLAGGRLKTLCREVTIAVKPTQIPVQLLVDVTPLGVAETLRLKDVSLEGARILDNPEQGVAFVEPPKSSKEEATKEAEGKKK